MASGIQHRWMTSDALSGLGLTASQTGSILKAVNQVDRAYGHPRHSCHRVGKYQRQFEEFGGKVCDFEGAESQAAKFLVRAQESWAAGDEGEAMKHLGYAIHFIQDALAPEHVFPLSEKLGLSIPHLNTEIYMTLKYRVSKWGKLARKSSVIQVSSPEDLRRKLEEAADWVNTLPCSYIRQDGKRIGSGISFSGWQMSDEDIGRWMERSASLVKGATILVVKGWRTRESSRSSPL